MLRYTGLFVQLELLCAFENILYKYFQCNQIKFIFPLHSPPSILWYEFRSFVLHSFISKQKIFFKRLNTVSQVIYLSFKGSHRPAISPPKGLQFHHWKVIMIILPLAESHQYYRKYTNDKKLSKLQTEPQLISESSLLQISTE